MGKHTPEIKPMKVDPKDNPHGHPIPDFWDELTDEEKRFLLEAPIVDIAPPDATGVVVTRAKKRANRPKPESRKSRRKAKNPKFVPEWVNRLSPEARAEFDAVDWDKEDESWVEDGTTYVAPWRAPAERKPK